VHAGRASSPAHRRRWQGRAQGPPPEGGGNTAELESVAPVSHREHTNQNFWYPPGGFVVTRVRLASSLAFAWVLMAVIGWHSLASSGNERAVGYTDKGSSALAVRALLEQEFALKSGPH